MQSCFHSNLAEFMKEMNAIPIIVENGLWINFKFWTRLFALHFVLIAQLWYIVGWTQLFYLDRETGFEEGKLWIQNQL